MALLCKKINKIERFYTDKLKTQLSQLNNKSCLLNFPMDLNSSIRIFLNFSDLNTNDNYIKNFKEEFLQKIIRDVKLEDNFGNKGYFESLKSKILKVFILNLKSFAH